MIDRRPGTRCKVGPADSECLVTRLWWDGGGGRGVATDIGINCLLSERGTGGGGRITIEFCPH